MTPRERAVALASSVDWCVDSAAWDTLVRCEERRLRLVEKVGDFMRGVGPSDLPSEHKRELYFAMIEELEA